MVPKEYFKIMLFLALHFASKAHVETTILSLVTHAL